MQNVKASLTSPQPDIRAECPRFAVHKLHLPRDFVRVAYLFQLLRSIRYRILLAQLNLTCSTSQ
jgi:hypothetical protein